LERLIDTHLFIICPNNSGSTFLMNALATSHATWNLAVEGQHSLGFHGPSTRESGAHLIWAASRRWIDVFTDASAYDWRLSRRAWYFQARSRNASATVMVVKSPPFLLNVGALDRHFANARFLFMVRNPYAMAEGILRRRRHQPPEPAADVPELAARHVVECFRRQRGNIAGYAESGIFFTYEEMCAHPEAVAACIAGLVPAIDDLDLRRRLPVKGLYNDMLRDMNGDQIGRLSAAEIAGLSRGSVTSRNARQGEAPSERAASTGAASR
jgi:hypothetical protein